MPPSNDSLFLWGMPGVGKTTVGRLLASLLGRSFCDTDLLFQERFALTPAECLVRDGEPAFRALEQQIVKETLSLERTVVSLGGGALLDDDLLESVSSSGTLIGLTASLDALKDRLGTVPRPLLKTQSLDSILKSRAIAYSKVHKSVATDGRTPLEVALDIRALLEPRQQRRDTGDQFSQHAPGMSQCWLEVSKDTHPVRVSSLEGFEGLKEFVLGVAGPRRCYLLVDEGLPATDRQALGELFGESRVRVVPGGESAKTLATLSDCSEWLAGNLADRDSLLLAVGGGALLDLVGVVASLFMRGIRWITVPTTLLASVDAAVGGKCAVDTSDGKNLLGSFWFPQGVFVPLEVVGREVAARQVPDGLAEALKMELLFGDSDSAGRCVAEWQHRGELEALRSMVERAVWRKIRVVSRDPRELTGFRRFLNLGHSFAHAAEQGSGYRLSHGAAVGWGLVVATRVSVDLGIATEEFSSEVESLCRLAGLWPPPVQLPADVLSRVALDKKRQGDDVWEVLLHDFGSVEIRRIPARQLENLMASRM